MDFIEIGKDQLLRISYIKYVQLARSYQARDNRLVIKVISETGYYKNDTVSTIWYETDDITKSEFNRIKWLLTVGHGRPE